MAQFVGCGLNRDIRHMPVMVLGKGRWSLIERHVSRVVRAVKASKPGNDAEVDIPYA